MEGHERYRAILADSVVFRRLSPADLDPVLSASELIALKPGELILSEGTPGDGLYIILEGSVEIFLPPRAASGAHRPTRIRIARLGPGRCLGEYGVIDDQPSSASAAAQTAVTLCFLPKAKFRRLVEQNDHVGRIVYANLLRYLVDRLRGKNKEYDLIVLDAKR